MRSIIRLPWALQLSQPLVDMHPECREHLFPGDKLREKVDATPPQPTTQFDQESSDKCVHYRQLGIEALSGIFLIGLCCLGAAMLLFLVCDSFTIIAVTPNHSGRVNCPAIVCACQSLVNLCIVTHICVCNFVCNCFSTTHKCNASSFKIFDMSTTRLINLNFR